MLLLLPDGNLASGSLDMTVKIWDVEKGSLKATLTGHTHAVCALAVVGNNRIASGSGDETVKVWNYWMAVVGSA